MNENLIGREIWVEMDEDKSATRFSPRKGVVVHVFARPPEMQMGGCQIDATCPSFPSSPAPYDAHSASVSIPRKGESREDLRKGEFLRRGARTKAQKGNGEGFEIGRAHV